MAGLLLGSSVSLGDALDRHGLEDNRRLRLILRTGGHLGYLLHDVVALNDLAEDATWPRGIVTAFANYGVVLFGALLVLAWWQGRTERNLERTVRAILAGVGVLLAVAVNQPIVNTVHEARPYTALRNVTLLVHRSVDPSFPSDHATMAGAVSIGLMLTSWRIGLAACALALFMAFSRVYVGAHYPVDVLVGLELGGIVAATVQLATPHGVRIARSLLRTPMRALITS